MPREEGYAVLKATPEHVFNYLTDPANLHKMLQPNVVTQVGDVEPLPGGGYRYRWAYRMLGIPLKAESETVEYVPHERFAVKSIGFVDTISRWVLEPHEEGTRASFSIEYEMPPSLIGRLSGSFVTNQVKYSVQVALLTVRRLVESEPSGGAAKPPVGL